MNWRLWIGNGNGRSCVYTSMDFLMEPRLAAPQPAPGEIVVKPPPDLPRETPANPLSRLLPVAMVVATVGMMVLYFTSGASAMRNPMFMFFPVMMLVSLLGTVATRGRGGSRAAEINQNRREYLRYLASVESQLVNAAEQQRVLLEWHNPDPAALWAMIGSRRMWERVPGDTDFGQTRIGTATQPLSTPFVVPDLEAREDADPVTFTELRRLAGSRSTVPDLPLSIALTESGAVVVDGDAPDGRSLLRAALCHLAVMHSPQHLRLAAVVDPFTAQEWEWLKWLPHHQHPESVDDGGPARLTFRSLAAAETSLARCGGAHVVLVIDADPIPDGPRVFGAATTIALGPASDHAADLHLVVREGDLLVRRDDGEELRGCPDAMTAGQAVAAARRLSRYRPVPTSSATAHVSPSISWKGLMDSARRGRDEMLSVPIGVSERGERVELDIKEAAAGGMGPHGLCIGATGSGKSEFLRTLTLGMITAHPSEVLNLVLVDFKGGATFLGFERAPHVAAVITNLADEAPLVARMKDALAGEVNRRQELLRAAGNVANIAHYNAARAEGAALAPLPALFIVVDEFSELLTHHPDFIELFIAIGRLGRSLGIHLLLASQRVDEARLRGLESHLSYRVCLKTFSAAESRSVLGVPDAYHLPSTPGAAYLKVGAGDPVRFQTAFVSGVDVSSPADPGRTVVPSTPRVFTAAPMGSVVSETGQPSRTSSSRTTLEAVLDQLEGHGSAAHHVWLPPLRESPKLVSLLPHFRAGSPLTVPIGLVDSPYEQRREFLVAQLAGATGNVAVVGAPRSGKSTAVQTLMLALAETHDPGDVQFYCLDFGGGVLSSLSTLPHVGSVAGRRDVELVRRTVVQLESLLRAREERRNSPGSALGDDPYGEVFLLVDGWATVRQEFDSLEASITALAAQGLSYGIHVIVAASRWAEIRPALKDLIGTRIELRLGDPAESEMDRKRARQLAQSPPGRGITRDGRELVIADSPFDTATADRLRTRYAGRLAPRIEVLPTRVGYVAMLGQSRVEQPGTQLLLGLGETELAPVAIDFAAESHLVILGEGECGKTSVLRTLCTEIVRTNTAQTAQMYVVDFRRTMLGVVETEHLAGYIPSSAALHSRMGALVERLNARTPGADVTQQQLRSRSWWSGPEMYIVIDDYDLVAPTGSANPLTPLLGFLPYAKDLGLHIVVARRSGGAARAMFDPVLAALRDLGTMGLMMSASPDEGVLLGSVRPSRLPAGRGTLIARAQPQQLVQVAWIDCP